MFGLRPSLRVQLVLWVGGLVIVLVGALGMAIDDAASHSEGEVLKDSSLAYAHTVAQDVRAALAELEYVTEFVALSARSLERGPVAVGDDGVWREALAMQMRDHLDRNPALLQLRLLDGETGHELVRVHREPPRMEPRVVPDVQLQDKGDRPYFLEAVRSPGRLIYSEIDLNVEHGRVEIPHRPVLRASIRLEGVVGNVVVANYDIQALFSRVRARVPDRWELIIVDEQQRILAHPDSALPFAWVVRKSPTALELRPELAVVLEGEDARAVRVGDAVLARTRVPLGRDESLRAVDIVVGIPSDVVIASYAGIHRRTWAGGVALLVLLLLAVSAVTGRLTRSLKQLTLAVAELGQTGSLGTLPLEGAPPDVRAIADALREATARLGARSGQLEVALEERAQVEKHLRSLLSRLPVGVLVVDDAGDVQFANQRATRIFGVADAQLLGRPIAEMLPVDIEAWRGLFDLVEGAPSPWGLSMGAQRLSTRRSDGSELLLSVAYSPLQLGVVGSFAITVEDVGEQVRREAAERESGRLAAVAQLAGHVAHDFNNVLTGITASLHILDAVSNSPDVLDALKEIGEATNRARRLTESLLAASGGGAMTRQAVRASVLADEAVAIAVELVPGARVVCLVEPPDLVVHADERMMGILIRSAVRLTAGRSACSTEGTFTLEVRRSQSGGAFAELTVAWSGPTEDSGGQDRELLVAVIRGIISAHGWEFSLRDDAALGRALQLRLPLRSRSRATPQPRVRSNASRGEVILVIDDELVVRRVAATILTSQGYTVLEANDGDDGLEIFEANADRIGLVISDLSMPRMHGMEVYAVLREMFVDLPIVLSSGYSSAAYGALRLDEDEFLSFLPKPFTAFDLLQVVQAHLGRPNQLRAEELVET